MTRSYDISVVRYPDGTRRVTHRHIDGEWWCEWVVADTEELAHLHSRAAHYSGPGMSFTGMPIGVQHPKKVVLFQSGGLDI